MNLTEYGHRILFYDKIAFLSDGKTPLKVRRGSKIVSFTFPLGTIVVDSGLRRETESGKVLAIMPSGKICAPCGACRELMTQLTPGKYQDIEIMLDYEKERIATPGELTPEWWI